MSGSFLFLIASVLAAPASSLSLTSHIAQDSSGYYWPTGNGRPAQYSVSPYAGPKSLTAALAWTWQHPGGKYHTIAYGTAIDDKEHIYLTTDTSLWKLTPDGNTVWSYYPEPGRRANFFSAGSLLDGRMYASTLDGRVMAVSMDTGKLLWSTKVCEYLSEDNGFVSASEGVVIATSDNGQRGNDLVRGFKVDNGELLWTFKPDTATWNFLASFPGDGTFIFQDYTGKAYRNRLSDGQNIWKSGGSPGTWTDGTAALGPNGIVYAMSAFMENQPGMNPPVGYLRAHRLSDGKMLWEQGTPAPPNNIPAIGRLAGKKGLSVVQPIGWPGDGFKSTVVRAYDAETGELQWNFEGPVMYSQYQPGMVEGVEERKSAGSNAGYITNAWSAPAIDADGTVYVGNQVGSFHALRDLNGDGDVTGDAEVASMYPMGAPYVGCSGPSFSPHLMAIATCDTLFVFKENIKDKWA